jgi:hypothetical protein
MTSTMQNDRPVAVSTRTPGKRRRRTNRARPVVFARPPILLLPTAPLRVDVASLEHWLDLNA